jgi:hypothetical protein
MKALKFSFVSLRFHSRHRFFAGVPVCETIALAGYENDSGGSRALLVRSDYQSVVHRLGIPQDVVFVNTFLHGFAPFFTTCTSPDSVCRGIREDLLKAKDMLEFSDSKTIWGWRLDSALARIGKDYVKFEDGQPDYYERAEASLSSVEELRRDRVLFSKSRFG